jgi:hypothetical protein
MALVNPPFCLQAATAKHSAQLFRQAISSLINPAGGLLSETALTVEQNATPNMSVEITGGKPSEGGAWVPGTSATGTQGLYYCWNSANFNQPIEASGAANPRVDTVVLQIFDEQYAGAKNECEFEVLKGKEETGVTLSNRKGAAAVPASCLILAYVLVPAKATTIVTADIENVATVCALGLLITGSQLGNGTVHAPTTAASQQILRGRISSGNAEPAGLGWTCENKGTGLYTVIAAVPFVTFPACVVGLENPSTQAQIVRVGKVNGSGPYTGFDIRIVEGSSLVGGIVHFVAIG